MRKYLHSYTRDALLDLMRFFIVFVGVKKFSFNIDRFGENISLSDAVIMTEFKMPYEWARVI